MRGLFERVLQADTAAQAEVDRCIRRIARVVCRGGGPGGDADWEDVAQEASRYCFAVAIHQFRKAGAEESFLYTIVRTSLLQIVRAGSRRRDREATAMEHLTLPRHNPGPAIDVRSILRRLPEECATLLRRVFLLGEPYQVLAAEMKMLESSVRTKVTRCLRKAREMSGQVQEDWS